MEFSPVRPTVQARWTRCSRGREEEDELAEKISGAEGSGGVIIQAGHLDKYKEVKMEYREVKKKVAKTMDIW